MWFKWDGKERHFLPLLQTVCVSVCLHAHSDTMFKSQPKNISTMENMFHERDSLLTCLPLKSCMLATVMLKCTCREVNTVACASERLSVTDVKATVKMPAVVLYRKTKLNQDSRKRHILSKPKYGMLSLSSLSMTHCSYNWTLYSCKNVTRKNE